MNATATQSSIRTGCDEPAQAPLPSTLIAALRRLGATPAALPVAAIAGDTEAQERCDFCGRPIPPDHRHFADLATMQFKCACETCAILQAERDVFKPLPQRYRFLSSFRWPEGLWHKFAIPVELAFFTFNSARSRVVAFYPAPTGATESQLNLEAWAELARLNPVLGELIPDLEALLVNRTGDTPEHYLVPIDCCYRIVGIMRHSWQGLAGGPDAFAAVLRFFQELKEKSSCPT